LLAKPMIVTLPVLLLLVDAWPLGRLRSAADLPALLREKAAFFALAAASAVVTVHAQHAGGAVQSLESFPLATRLGNAPLATVTYVHAFLWPRELSAFYPHPGALLAWPAAAAAVAALAMATVLAVRSGRGYLAAGWLWFLVALVPVIGIVQVGEQARADRYTYVPYVGLAVVFVWGAAEVLDRARVRAPARAALSLALVASLVAATRAELPHWRNARALFGRALELDPRNVFARQNLAVALLYEGDLAEARRHLDRVLELRPDYPFALRAAAEAASRQGDPAAAARYLERLLRVAPDDPVSATRAADLALADGDLPGALHRYAAVRRAAPGFTPAAYPYALALLVAGQLDAGLEQLAFAAAGSPDRADWAAQLAGARHLAAGADGPGRPELERALAERHRARASGLRRHGRETEAARHDAEASRLAR
jgi:tetratricopeptide (TPR) repeat protein